jgi:ectoine hydroxylase-related dioxygenase (phytanoyl-CoA dioxygenase family)
MLSSYNRDGFLLLTDAVDRKTVERARLALITQIPREHGNPYHVFASHSAVLACFNKEVCSAAAVLAGVRKRFAPPSTSYTVSVFPTSGPWRWPPAHIDHSHEKDAHQTFPPPYQIGCLIYLTGIQSHGGGTIVWPGSRHRLEELAAANRERYQYLAPLNRDIPTLDLGCPKEITARAGDVLFYHYLCAHAGSANTGTEPRFALNHKW